MLIPLFANPLLTAAMLNLARRYSTLLSRALRRAPRSGFYIGLEINHSPAPVLSTLRHMFRKTIYDGMRSICKAGQALGALPTSLDKSRVLASLSWELAKFSLD